jgi:Gas vesicle synthesis protein GvpL/GvpF
VIELYALTDHPAPSLPDLAPLSTVAHDGLAFVWAPAPTTTELSPELLWRHEELLEKLMEDRDLLPVRYGTRLSDEADAARALRERHHELALALDRVRGAVELSVRVIGTGREPPPAEGMSGTEYLRAREQTSAARASALRAVHEPLSLSARAGSERAPRAAGELVRAAYLVDREAVQEFTSMVTRLQAEQPRLRLLCTGPWPPYSFSEP